MCKAKFLMIRPLWFFVSRDCLSLGYFCFYLCIYTERIPTVSYFGTSTMAASSLAEFRTWYTAVKLLELDDLVACLGSAMRARGILKKGEWPHRGQGVVWFIGNDGDC